MSTETLTMKPNQDKILAMLGLTEEDIKISEALFKQMPLPPPPSRSAGSTKIESVLGFAAQRIEREKALKMLGTSEDELEIENSKNLGALGLSGRRRSFLVPENAGCFHSNMCSPADYIYKRRKSSVDRHSEPSRKRRSIKATSLRRRSTSTGKSSNRKRSHSRPVENDAAITADETNRLKEALFEAQGEISKLQSRIEHLLQNDTRT